MYNRLVMENGMFVVHDIIKHVRNLFHDHSKAYEAISPYIGRHISFGTRCCIVFFTSFHRLVQEGSNLSSVVNNAIPFVCYHTSYPLLCPSFSERPCRFCYEMVIIIKNNNIWTRTLIQKKHTHTFIGSRKMNKIRQNLSSPYIKHREGSVR